MLGLTGIAALQDAAPPPAAPGGYGAFLLQTFLVLILVCVLAWAVVRFGLKRITAPRGAEGPLKVIARLSLEPRRTLFLVDCAGKVLLLGTSEGGPMTVLCELDPEVVGRARASAEPQRSFLEILKDKVLPGSGKEAE